MTYRRFFIIIYYNYFISQRTSINNSCSMIIAMRWNEQRSKYINKTITHCHYTLFQRLFSILQDIHHMNSDTPNIIRVQAKTPTTKHRYHVLQFESFQIKDKSEINGCTSCSDSNQLIVPIQRINPKVVHIINIIGSQTDDCKCKLDILHVVEH